MSSKNDEANGCMHDMDLLIILHYLHILREYPQCPPPPPLGQCTWRHATYRCIQRNNPCKAYLPQCENDKNLKLTHVGGQAERHKACHTPTQKNQA